MKIFLPSNYFQLNTGFYLTIGLIVCIIIIYYWNRYVSYLTINKNDLTIQNILKKEKISLNEIIGFEKEYWTFTYSKALKYILIKTKRKTIKIYPYYNDSNELIKWIETNFTNLNAVKAHNEWEQVLNDEDIGMDRFERLQKVKKAKNIAILLNCTSIIIFPFYFFSPTRPFIIIPAIIIPLLTFIAIFYFKGIIKLDDFSGKSLVRRIEKQSDPTTHNSTVYTYIFGAIALPTLILLGIYFIDFNVINFNGLWKVSLIISTIIFALCLIRTKEFKSNKLMSYVSLSMIYIFIYGYTFFGAIALNCALDFSTPEKETSIIVNKYVSGGKYDYYSIVIDKMNENKPIKLRVSEDMYNEYQVKTNFTFYNKEGLLKMNWISYDK
ncbi:hypothetical protein [Allomuricauda sp. F6463D]|uniref:hypothetical protein n=1 Tax=Allomuricauda sp. F6463D TaxID=2926409 RepID=UPI001FF68C7C|nr:hypothetical protein [Muricauda sp. F6463D]MCK0159450.1 hypothetical protein [Muricauda sp. F6463D]